MFVDAIKKAGKFTRPIYFIEKEYGNDVVENGSATMFFVNEQGYAVTCKHVASALIKAEQLKLKYSNFKEDVKLLGKQTAEDKHKIKKGEVVQIVPSFPYSVVNFKSVSFILHHKYDIAIIKFENFDKKSYDTHAYFPKDNENIMQGLSVCKLGFPFPEFSNYEYDRENDKIMFTNKGKIATPSFPLEGIITRFIRDEENLYGIETSTPGLKGQSGGPLFDKDGTVIGMQSITRHIHLGFDIENYKFKKRNEVKSVSNYQFINLGISVHVEVIKKFLDENNVKYYTK